MNRYRTGLVVGSFAAFVHLVWVLLVALNLAESWRNFVMKMHFLSDSSSVLPFEFGKAVGLIILAFIMGNIVGYIFATFWNKIHK